MSSAEFDSTASQPEKNRPLIAGRYRTIRKIGHGRLGEIFSALDEGYQDIGVEQQRTIQLIPESVVQNQKVFRKLSQGYSELRASAHPNLVDYIECGQDGKFGFLVTEMLEGASLRVVLDIQKALPLDEVKPVIRGVGEALSLLHAKGLVHGNLTTKNVFITDDLEVKLLDVLPINPVEAVVRSSGNPDPFSRCSVEDDVFGLASLAYEMLSGRHPFNHSTQSEASAAGLEAGRIDGLSNGEWNAIHHALSLDRESRTPTVRDFMRALGIDGDERVQPSDDQPVLAATVDAPSGDNTAPRSRAQIGAEPVTATPVFERRSAYVDPDSQQPGRRRTVFLAFLFACLGVWLNVGEPEESAIALIGYLDETFLLELVPQSVVAVESSTRSAETPAVEDVSPPQDGSEAVAVAQPGLSQEDAMTGPPEPKVVEDSQPMSLARYPVSDESGSVAPATAGGGLTDSFVDVRIQLDEPAAADDRPGRLDAAPKSIVAQTEITVSERDGVARIFTQLDAWPQARMIWWTSDDTATGDEDFVAINQEPVVRPPRNEDSVLLVPLINDNLPERSESFFVNFGVQDVRPGQLQHIATVRVTIIDDD